MLGFSVYGPTEGVPELGARAPLIGATRVRDGATFRLEQQRGSAVLLVFFRGAW
jgi:peroxiredoxin